MASITKYKDGWRAAVKFKGRRETKTFTTKRAAQHWADATITQMRADGSDVPGDTYTLGDALAKYEREVAPELKSGFRIHYRLESFYRDLPTTKPISSITPEHLIEWRNKRLAQVSPGTVLREISQLGGVFRNALKEWRWITSNPMLQVQRPKMPRHRERVISPAETRVILRGLDYCPMGKISSIKQIVGAQTLIALCTGMRAGEIVGLTWDRMHGSWVTLDDTKNGTPRDVPLSRAARRLVERMRGLNDKFVFPASDASRDKWFRSACISAGIEGVRFYDARHTAATRIGATVGQPGRLSFPEFCKVFGWRDPKFAMVYVNPSAASLADIRADGARLSMPTDW